MHRSEGNEKGGRRYQGHPPGGGVVDGEEVVQHLCLLAAICPRAVFRVSNLGPKASPSFRHACMVILPSLSGPDRKWL
jgi:hypothetical protein